MHIQNSQVRRLAWQKTAAAFPSVKQDGTSSALPAKQQEAGLPTDLKEGLERLSGLAMDNVQVHYNSAKPAQLQSYAYAQGNHIHLGPGQERHLPHEAWHVVQQKQGRVSSGAGAEAKTGFGDVIQRKVFLFSGGVNTPLTQGADWFGNKPSNLAPSDEDMYIEGITNQFPNHAIIDMYGGNVNYGLNPGETAIIVAHGKQGGGKDSFSNDNGIVVTAEVILAVEQILATNRQRPLRIFVAACNSARESKSIKVGSIGDSPVRQIIEKLNLYDAVEQGQVIFEGYTAQAGLHNYDNENQVTSAKKGRHIWGKNNVTQSGNINDNQVPKTEMLFGYDTSLTARAYINRNTKNKVHYTGQSQPFDSFHGINMDQLQQNVPLFSTMKSTVKPQPPQVLMGYASGNDEEEDDMQMEEELPDKHQLHESVLTEAERMGVDLTYDIGFADGTDHNCSIIAIYGAAGVELSGAEAADIRQELGITGSGDIDLTPQLALEILNKLKQRTGKNYTLHLLREEVREDEYAEPDYAVDEYASTGGGLSIFIFFAGTHFSPAWHK